MNTTNWKVLCIESGDEEDVKVGEIYEVCNGLLYTKLKPQEREQEIDYNNIIDLNLCEERYGNKFIKV